MFRFLKILERIEVFPYLEKRGLLKQYKKAKMFLMNGNLVVFDVDDHS